MRAAIRRNKNAIRMQLDAIRCNEAVMILTRRVRGAVVSWRIIALSIIFFVAQGLGTKIACPCTGFIIATIIAQRRNAT